MLSILFYSAYTVALAQAISTTFASKCGHLQLCEVRRESWSDHLTDVSLLALDVVVLLDLQT